MNRLFALLAALALALSPMTAAAASAGCQMTAAQETGQDMAMPMPTTHEDGGAKSSDPCCKHDKACAMACGQSCAPIAALPATGPGLGVRGTVLSLSPMAYREPASLAPAPDRPPPRTTA